MTRDTAARHASGRAIRASRPPARRRAAICALGLVGGWLLAAGGPPLLAQLDGAPEKAIQEVLEQYSAALESLDADEVKKVQPSIDVDGLKKAFTQMRELEVKIENVKVLQADGTSARVSCRVTQTLTPRAGAKQTTTLTRVFRLRKLGEAWVVDGFER